MKRSLANTTEELVATAPATPAPKNKAPKKKAPKKNAPKKDGPLGFLDATGTWVEFTPEMEEHDGYWSDDTDDALWLSVPDRSEMIPEPSPGAVEVEDLSAEGPPAPTPPANRASRTRAKETPDAALAPRRTVEVSNKVVSIEGMEGDYGASDIETPILKIVQPTSGCLTEGWADSLGSWLYDETIDLGRDLEVAVLRCRKKFEEVVRNEDFDPSSPNPAYDSEEECRANGVDDFREFAFLDILIMVDVDSDAADYALFQDDETAFLLASVRLKSRSYGFVRKMRKFMAIKRDTSTLDRTYLLKSVSAPVRGKDFHKAVCAMGSPIDENTQQWLKDKVANPSG